jgi:hypothetical protein
VKDGAHGSAELDELFGSRQAARRGTVAGQSLRQRPEPSARLKRITQPVKDLSANGVDGVVELDRQRLRAQGAGIRIHHLLMVHELDKR